VGLETRGELFEVVAGESVEEGGEVGACCSEVGDSMRERGSCVVMGEVTGVTAADL
jgi:hypothetical protein